MGNRDNKMVWLDKPYVEKHQSQLQLDRRAELHAAIKAELLMPLMTGHDLSGDEKQQIKERLIGRQRWMSMGAGSRKRAD